MLVCRTIPLKHFDPVHLFWSLYPDGPGFLESASRAPRTGRFSIVPLKCRETYILDEEGLRCQKDRVETVLEGDPFSVLEEIFNNRRIAETAAIPFVGGFFGSLAYDLAWWIEDLPRRAARDFPVPALWLTWVERCAVYDHDTQILHLAAIDGSDPLDWQNPILRHSRANFPNYSLRPHPPHLTWRPKRSRPWSIGQSRTSPPATSTRPISRAVSRPPAGAQAGLSTNACAP